MKKTKVIEFLKKYGIITLGCILYSLGIALFLDANKIASGGATGISILINYLFPQLDTGLVLLVINIPMFVMGWIVFGKKFVISTAYATVASSLLITLWQFIFDDVINVFPLVDLPSEPYMASLIAAISGATLFAVGMGLIFRMGASTAGTDVIVKWLRTKFRYLKTGMISMVTDITIVVFSTIVMHHENIGDIVVTLFFAILSIVVFTLIFDFVLYGGNSAKMVYIITEPDKSERMQARILSELDSGATVMEAHGAYTGKDKKVFLCAVKNIFFPKLKDVVKEVDKGAFMIVTSAQEVYGEGYKGHDDAEL
ncbi:MAG: YitT family protein [Clostridia bacterium]|nr:YitT family protein [Clostridia bacterium]